VATETSTEFWPVMPAAPSVTTAVLAQNEIEVRRIAETLERDGLLVNLAFAGFTEMGLEMLSPQPDVVIVDAAAEGFDSEGAVRRTRTALRRAAVVVICPRSSSRQLPRFLEAGADGVVFADELQTTLASAVRCACKGQISVPGSMRHVVSPPALSYREKEVLELAARGLTNSQIAGRLFLAESTVKTHLSSAFRRLGVSSRREAAALGERRVDRERLRRRQRRRHGGCHRGASSGDRTRRPRDPPAARRP
jgi:DNA-binding NarL/FixJ family response regulator